MREEQHLVQNEGDDRLVEVNVGHEDEDAGDAGGAGHAHGPRSAHCGREKVRCGCVRRLSAFQCPKFTPSLLMLRPWRSGVVYGRNVAKFTR